jgi:hypothetical protein
MRTLPPLVRSRYRGDRTSNALSAAVGRIQEFAKKTSSRGFVVQITDAALKRLHERTSLRTLWLSKTAVIDEGLKHLAKCTGLTKIYLDGTQVTDEGVVELKKALPQARIMH